MRAVRSMASMARTRDFLMNFPTGLSQGLLAWVGSGYVIYNVAKLGFYSVEGLVQDRDDKARRREQHFQEAVEKRAADADARREARARAAAAAAAAHGRQDRSGRRNWW